MPILSAAEWSVSKTAASGLGMAAASLMSESEQCICADVFAVPHAEHQDIKQTVFDASQMVSCITRQHHTYHMHAWEYTMLVV
jgi:hypothetical protein